MLLLRLVDERPAQPDHAGPVAPAIKQFAVLRLVERKLPQHRETIGIFPRRLDRGRVGIGIPAQRRMDQRGVDAGLIHFFQ